MRNKINAVIRKLNLRYRARTPGASTGTGCQDLAAGCPMPDARAAEGGFTLIEMMIVVTIIAFIAGLVGLNLIKRLDEARIDTTKTQIRQLLLALDDFKRVCGFYPTTEQGLDALVKTPVGRDCKNWEEFIKGGKLPKDAWGNDFAYFSDGQDPEVKSWGADNKEGGEGTDKDISSKDL